METSRVFSETLKAYVNPAVRTIVNEGGSSSTKTISELQLLIQIALRTKKHRIISVMSESMPHLRLGCIRDFQRIMEKEGLWDRERWNDGLKTYSFNRCQFEFFSADQSGKVTGPRRDILFVNEGINIPYETFRQAAIRTNEKVLIDHNPAFEYWAHTKVMPKPDTRVIHSTYRDNEWLPAAVIAELESNRESDPEWWKVYGLGQVGSRQGLIIKNWDIVQELPPRNTWKKCWIGIDFGWSSPTAIMLVVLGEKGEVWIDEIAYRRSMDNPDIAEAVHSAGHSGVECICDKAEPKSIEELRKAGIRAVASDNKDIDLGISVMNRYKKHYTARSLGSIEENRKYHYKPDTDGGYTGTPIDKFNHAKDAERYVFLNRLSGVSYGFDITVSTPRRK